MNSLPVALDEIKKQTLTLHQAIMMLELQYRFEAIDFLSDCCNDLRLKTFTYQDIGADHVLNLTMSHKEYVPFPGSFRTDDRFGEEMHVPSFCNPPAFAITNDAHQYDYDYGVMDCAIDIEDMNKSLDTHWVQPYDDWESKNSLNEAVNPVNLVMPIKEEKHLKKSRRKQMFTRKSIRRKGGIHSSTNNGIEKIKGQQCGIKGSKDKCPTTNYMMTISKGSGSLSCIKCRRQFSDFSLYARHKGSCKPRTKYSCKDCNVEFRFETHYLQHLSGHKQNDCKHCSKKFSSKEKYRAHLKKAHSEIKEENENIPCKFCNLSFSRLHRLYNHYQLRHSKGKFVCTICGLFLASKEKHKEHISEHDNDKKWQCDNCGKKFFSRRTLANHLKIHNAGKYRCLTCKMTVGSKLELVTHKRKKHDVIGLEAQFECDSCHKMFSKKWLLERHLSTHSPFKISTNSRGTDKQKVRDVGLNKHKILDDARESKYEKIYQDQLICESCGKQYKTYCQLNSHLRMHVASYACDTCGAAFNLKSNLRRHMKSHSSRRQAVCELCGDSFARVQGLREHNLIKHTDLRLFPCSDCPKSFKRRSELKRHMHIHTLTRPYVCFCGRAYKQSAHLRSHQKSVHSALNVTNSVAQPVTVSTMTADRSNNTDAPLLSIGHFDDRDYRLQEAVVNYGEGIGYETVAFGDGATTAVSPAVDLSMVAIPEPVAKPVEADVAMPLVNLSERIVQEYLLNLP